MRIFKTTPTTTAPGGVRARWAAVGAAVAVSLGAGGLGIVHATTPSGASAYVGTEPCRLLDTRPGAALHIGPFDAVGPNSKITVKAVGDVGECTGGTAIPASATGLQLNVTPIDATAATNLRIYPGNGVPPNASSLNPAPGQRPIPNAVSVQLDDDARFSIYNQQGNVDIAVDVVGYYTGHDHDDRYHTKQHVDSELARKANQADVDAALAGKADQADVAAALDQAPTTPLGTIAYMVNDEPTLPLNTKSPVNGGYSYNPFGETTINRVGTGAYLVSFDGIDLSLPNGGHAQVTRIMGNGYCNIRTWSQAAVVQVRCYDEIGADENARFALSLIG